METQDKILDAILEEFAGLAKIPRPSGHEKAVSDYLKKRLADLGLSPVQDEVNNLIADKPASPGHERAPRTILQAHMDMVCTAEEGVAYRPLEDPIRLRRSGDYLEAVGTSLGADDGIGIAEALYLAKHLDRHGPLRIIFTVDEECGMGGAIHLDAKHLADARFLLNCDSEHYDRLVVGSAGGVNLDFHKEVRWTQVINAKNAWQIAVSGLLGGHSGGHAGSGRGNAIRTLSMALSALDEAGLPWELASFRGGRARNVIPSSAVATIVTDADENALRAVLDAQREHFLEMYGLVDPGIQFSLQPTDVPAKVFAEEDKAAFLRLLQVLHTGVYAMSQAIPGMVETSANLGVAETTEHEAIVQFYPRSAIDRKIDEFCRTAKHYAAMCDFSVEIGTPSPGWKENKNSLLAKLVSETFAEQNGRPMKVESIHAGLECSWHFQKNPNLDIVSIGVTALDIHSPKERLVLSTVRPQVELIEAVLRKIADLHE